MLYDVIHQIHNFSTLFLAIIKIIPQNAYWIKVDRVELIAAPHSGLKSKKAGQNLENGFFEYGFRNFAQLLPIH